MPVYDDVILGGSVRTIIDVPEQQLAALAEICRELGISRAEAIRRAVAAWTEGRAAGLAAAFGLWKDRPIDALRYEDAIRDEW
jgi:hypothetical protein